MCSKFTTFNLVQSLKGPHITLRECSHKRPLQINKWMSERNEVHDGITRLIREELFGFDSTVWLCFGALAFRCFHIQLNETHEHQTASFCNLFGFVTFINSPACFACTLPPSHNERWWKQRRRQRFPSKSNSNGWKCERARIKKNAF